VVPYTQSCPHARSVRTTSACAPPNRCISAPHRAKRFVLSSLTSILVVVHAVVSTRLQRPRDVRLRVPEPVRFSTSSRETFRFNPAYSRTVSF
jgi:hypothetical protein